MVFKSQNKIRICKYCESTVKENIQIKNGKIRKKGYYKTCGSQLCRSAQYRDEYVCRSKGRLNEVRSRHCLCCEQKFQAYHPANTKFCIECVPDRSWRARAQRYGIGKPQWKELLEKQNFSCALCHRNPEVIDHCHKTGKIRGLLCNKCNVNIKFLDSEEEFINNAIKYVGINVSFC